MYHSELPPELGLSLTVMESVEGTLTAPSLTTTSKRSVSVALTLGVVIVAEAVFLPEIVASDPDDCAQAYA
jgi:hypothetical protein